MKLERKRRNFLQKLIKMENFLMFPSMIIRGNGFFSSFIPVILPLFELQKLLQLQQNLKNS